MPEPINYMGMYPQANPLGNLVQGLQAGAIIGDLRQKQIEADQAQELKKQYAIDLTDAFKRKDPSAFAELSAKYPGQREAFKQSWEMLSEGEKQHTFSQGSQVYTALQNGNLSLAKEILDTNIKATENTGKDASGLKNIRDLIDTNPEKVLGTTGLYLSSVDPEQWKKVQEAYVASQTAPEKVTQEIIATQKAGFETAIKQTEAEQAPEQQSAKTRQEIATAKTKEAEAKYAPKKYQLDVAKIGADIGLTNAQIGQARAITSKTLQEIENLKKEGKGLTIDPEKRFNMTKKLRDEYNAQTGDFIKTQDAYNKIKSARPDGVGDISLIFSYMKMLDPGSVVREGEFATAANSAGIPSAVTNMYNKAMSGERLTDKQRSDFKKQAKKLFSASAVREKQVRKGIQKISSAYGLSDDEIFYTNFQAEKVGQATTPSPSYAKNINPPAPKVATKKTQSLFNAADAIIFGGR